jgi:hypothetical protein
MAGVTLASRRMLGTDEERFGGAAAGASLESGGARNPRVRLRAGAAAAGAGDGLNFTAGAAGFPEVGPARRLAGVAATTAGGEGSRIGVGNVELPLAGLLAAGLASTMRIGSSAADAPLAKEGWLVLRVDLIGAGVRLLPLAGLVVAVAGGGW